MIKYYLYKLIYKNSLAALVSLFIFGLIYLFISQDQLDHLDQQKIVFNRLSNELIHQKAQIQKTSQYQQQLIQADQEWDALRAHWLSLEQVDTVFNDIESLVKQAGVNLTHISVDEAISITLNSDYISLLTFIELLNTRSYFLLTDLQLKRESGLILTVIYLQILLESDDA